MDLTTRYYKKLGNLSLEEMQNVVDIVQGLFDIY